MDKYSIISPEGSRVGKINIDNSVIIKVGGVGYKVNQVPFIEINGDRNYLGSCDFENQLIQVTSGLESGRKGQILTHELVHAIFNEAGFSEHDEDMVNRLGIVLYQVIKDNDLKELLKQL